MSEEKKQRLSSTTLIVRVKQVKLLLLIGFGITVAHLMYIQLIVPDRFINLTKKGGYQPGNNIIHIEVGQRGHILDRKERPFTAQKKVRAVKCSPANFSYEHFPNEKRRERNLIVLREIGRVFPKILDAYADHGDSFFAKKNFKLSSDASDREWKEITMALQGLYDSESIRNKPGTIIHESIEFRRHYLEGPWIGHLIGTTDPKKIKFKTHSNASPEPAGDAENKSVAAVQTTSEIEGPRIDNGVFGLEKVFDSWLSAKPGFRHGRYSKYRSFRQAELSPENGNHIVLTIDKLIQNVVEKQLDNIQEKFNPVASCIIVTHPATGKIIAMGARPGFDPNLSAEINWGFASKPTSKEEIRSNFSRESIAFSARFEPGSTIKPLVLAAAIEEDTIPPGTYINCPANYPVGFSYPIRESDRKAKGNIPWEGVIYLSSNVGTAIITQEMLGFGKTFDYIKRLGFSSYTSGTHLNGEVVGDMQPSAAKYPLVDQLRVPIGQTINVTGIQLMMAYGAIANDGILKEARVIEKRIAVDSSGKSNDIPYPSSDIQRGIFSPDTCDRVIMAMREVTENSRGTGRQAALEHYTVAGKTGTSEIKSPTAGWKIPPTHRKYSGSFIGFFPASTSSDPEVRKEIINNRFCVGVWVYAPKRSSIHYYGGSVSSEAFKKVSETVAHVYGIKPDKTTEITQVIRP